MTDISKGKAPPLPLSSRIRLGQSPPPPPQYKADVMTTLSVLPPHPPLHPLRVCAIHKDIHIGNSSFQHQHWFNTFKRERTH